MAFFPFSTVEKLEICSTFPILWLFFSNKVTAISLFYFEGFSFILPHDFLYEIHPYNITKYEAFLPRPPAPPEI